MTNSEAILILIKMIPQPLRGDGKSTTHVMMTEALTMAIQALNQESVLDKIRAEIADIYCGQYCENTMNASEMKEQVLGIIDKYGEEVGKKYKHSCCYWENNECILGRDYCPDDYRCDSFD